VRARRVGLLFGVGWPSGASRSWSWPLLDPFSSFFFPSRKGGRTGDGGEEGGSVKGTARSFFYKFPLLWIVGCGKEG
jgi:hypothetical protein